jgi:hypothetical protein
VRRHWPDALISWTRLQAGRLRDPLIASHVLAGFLAILVGGSVFVEVKMLISAPLDRPTQGIMALNSPGYFAARILGGVYGALFYTMAIVLVVVLLRLLLRRVWIADVVGSLLLGIAIGVDFSTPYRFAATAAVTSLLVYVFLWLLRRFGLLALLAAWVANGIFNAAPISLTSWYAGRTLVGLAILVAIPAWALWVILSAQRRPATEK